MKSINVSTQALGPANSFEYKSNPQIMTVAELQKFACSLWTKHRVASGPQPCLYMGF